MNKFRKHLTLAIIILFISINLTSIINGNPQGIYTLKYKKLNIENTELFILNKIPGFKNPYIVDYNLEYWKNKTIEITPYQKIDIGDYIPHDPIYIDGSSDFAAQAEKEGWPGEGTKDNPYIIENYNINASKSNGIEIRNTNLYFIIKNCVIHDGTYHSGIYFKNVRNGIVNGVIFYNNEVGIDLADSYDNIISNNSITNNYDGMRLDSSRSNNIMHNNISNNQYGIWFVSSTSNNIMHNNISNNQYGIFHSSGNNIMHNSISDNQYGIFGSSSNNIMHNNISNNQYGIHLYSFLESPNSNLIIYNNIYSNSWAGIWIESPIPSPPLSHNNVMNDDGIFIFGGLQHWNTHTIENNTINGKPLYYFKNQIGGMVPRDAGEVILANSTEMIIENLSINNTTVGIELGFSTQNIIINNSISNNQYGIHLYSSSSNIMHNNIYLNNWTGIWILSPINKITYNDIYSNNWAGIYIEYSYHNSIEKNNFIDNNLYHAYFKNSFLNNWTNNYWDDWNKNLPRPIYGRIEINPLEDPNPWITIPWINFDWHPAREPYDIDGGGI